MNIFISVAGADRPKVEEVALALRGEGHRVFLDEHELPPGESYHRRIREAILKADLVVFFVSARSLQADRYTMTELQIIQDKWPHPRGRVLPTLLEQIELNRIPPYLKAVSLCKPQGNLAASVAYQVSRMSDALPRQAPMPAVALMGEPDTLWQRPRAAMPFAYGLVAAFGLAVFTIIVASWADELVRLFGRMPLIYLQLFQGTVVALLVWLAAALFGVRNPLHFAALAAGCIGANLFEIYATRAMRLSDPLIANIAIGTGKALCIAICAAMVMPAFRNAGSIAALMAAGAIGGLIAKSFAFGISLERFIWEALIVFMIAAILSHEAASNGRAEARRSRGTASGGRGELDVRRAR